MPFIVHRINESMNLEEWASDEPSAVPESETVVDLQINFSDNRETIVAQLNESDARCLSKLLSEIFKF